MFYYVDELSLLFEREVRYQFAGRRYSLLLMRHRNVLQRCIWILEYRTLLHLVNEYGGPMPVCPFAQMGTLVVRPKQKATEIVRGRMENIAVRAACLGFPGILQPPHWCHHLLRRIPTYTRIKYFTSSSCICLPRSQ